VITYGIEPADAVFIDDNASNVEAAERLGFVALQFVDERSLRADLGRLGLLV
jgi:2-haloacid dehalogenase